MRLWSVKHRCVNISNFRTACATGSVVTRTNPHRGSLPFNRHHGCMMLSILSMQQAVNGQPDNDTALPPTFKEKQKILHQQGLVGAGALGKPKILIVTGPTAVGKTAVSLQLAHRLNGEIISADSVQVYRHMDVGSDKVCCKRLHGRLCSCYARRRVAMTPLACTPLPSMVRGTCDSSPSLLHMRTHAATNRCCCRSNWGKAVPSTCCTACCTVHLRSLPSQQGIPAQLVTASRVALQIAVAERQGVSHHLLDIIEPTEEFSAGHFHRLARAAANDILQVHHP